MERQPEGTKRATSSSVQLLHLRKNLCTGSTSRDIVNFPSELCRRRSGLFTEAARLAPPDTARLLLGRVSADLTCWVESLLTLPAGYIFCRLYLRDGETACFLPGKVFADSGPSETSAGPQHLGYIILYYIILYYTIFYYILLYYTTLYYIILYYTISYYILLYSITLHYTILQYIILYPMILYNVILYLHYVAVRRQARSTCRGAARSARCGARPTAASRRNNI